MNMRNSGYLGMASPAYTGPVGTMNYGGAQPATVAHAHAHAHATATTQPVAATQQTYGGQFTAPMGSYSAPVNYAPAQFASPIVHPTQHSVSKNVSKQIVPHIHPSHHHTMNEHIYQHQHYVTHTTSQSNKCCNQHVFCGPIPPPCPPRPKYCGW